MQGDAPIAYIDRTRAYYRALGYDKPYDWAQNDRIPLTPLPRPLSACSVAIVTTAAPYRPGKGDQGPGASYNAAAKFYRVYDGPTATLPDLRIAHVAIDRDHTTAADIGTYFPLAALKAAAAAGRIGRVADRFFGLPTNRSQKTTQDTDATDLVARGLAAQVDAAVLVANCPVCHQSAALAARALESAGIATVVMGCALDIVTRAGAPRFLFSDFPLGNAAGRPGDRASQRRTLEMALDLLETADAPGATRVSPLTWPGPPGWKDDYCNAAKLTAEERARRRAGFDAGRRAARKLRERRGRVGFD